MSTIGTRLVDLRERSGLTLDQIAALANYKGRSSVQKFFNADYDPAALDMMVAGRLARALVGRGSPPIEEVEVFELTAEKENRLLRYKYKTMAGLERDVPVYIGAFFRHITGDGDLEGFGLYVIDLDNPVSFAWHPPALETMVGFYGVSIFDRPLVPRFKPGEVMFVDGARPAKLGDDVCVHVQEFDDDKLSENPDADRPRASAIVLFGVLERQSMTQIFVRAFDGTRVSALDLSATKEIRRLISLSEALAPAYPID